MSESAGPTAPVASPSPLVLEVQTPSSVSLSAILERRKAAMAAGLARPLVGTAGEHGTPDMLDPTAGPVPLLSQPLKSEAVFEVVSSDPTPGNVRTIWDAQEGESGPFLICAPPESDPAPVREARPFPAVLAEVKAAGEDFEWYPTTSEIIADVIKHIPQYVGGSYERRYSASHQVASLLDVGAGNGKVLMAVKKAWERMERSLSVYAIEKSATLIGELDPCVYVVGTEFEAQSLYSKKVDVIFSNPPYSVFEEWSAKIIRESAAPLVLLVIPERWKDSKIIKAALESRGCKSPRVLGTYDFASAEDRKARAKVDLVRVDLSGDPDAAFEAFFNEQFGEFIAKHEERKKESEGDEADRGGRRKRPFHTLTVGENYPAALCGLYRMELANIQRNYEAISKLDPDLLREFEVYPKKIMELLKTRTSELRIEYWRELFSHLKPITNRLTAASRKSMLETLHARMDVDFTEDNIHAILIWAIKNANGYMDRQLIAVYELMVGKANVVNYKSNHRVFVARGWRYEDEEKAKQNSHYALELRIVVERAGGINGDRYAWHGWKECGLTENAGDFLSDLITLANNLGFYCCDSPREHQWTSGLSVTFRYTDSKGRRRDLFNARAFQNQNIHIKFAKEFILALNVEHGRLKGWLRDAQEAAEELKDPAAAQFFKSTFQILPGSSSTLLLS